ncbi:MAG: hypothetical protein HY788_20860 [Deltaproteobacteria bacterium]|nr:hypothetical protein [Deltaproteobacteria bacterium]
MIRALDLQSVLNQTPNVEKAGHSQQQNNDHQGPRFSMQLEQERQAAQKRVSDSDDSHGARKRDRREKDDRGKQADHDRKSDEESPGKEPAVVDLLNIRLLDITI